MGWTEQQLREENSGVFLEALGEAYEAIERYNNKKHG